MRFGRAAVGWCHVDGVRRVRGRCCDAGGESGALANWAALAKVKGVSDCV